MPAISQWWSNRSDPERFDLYTRWSLYILLGVAPGLVLLILLSSSAASGPLLAIIIVSVSQTGASIVLLRQGITRYLGGDRPPAAMTAVVALLTFAGLTLVLTAPGLSFADDNDANNWLPNLFLIVGLAGLSPMLRSRQLLLLAAMLTVAVAGVAYWQSGEPGRAIAAVIGIGIGLASITLTFRISVWMLKAFWQIDRSRTVESALAVAEERLRFSRDLHDVLGRNLSVIAVKSELASELVRRSRPEAATEIAEVNRIAQESLREVRAVVRGYREADFATELAGARGILAAAGIDCQVEGDPTMLPVDIQKTLGWVVREATTNVLRHSRARTCTIAITQGGGVAVLTVDNDGVPDDDGPPDRGRPHAEGISADGVDHPGSGLSGLRERLVALGGTLQAGPATGDRFRLVASIPLERSQRASTEPVTPVADVPTDPVTAATEQR